MPKLASNILSIRAGDDGWFFLTGYADGVQVRRKNKNLSELETLKTQLESDAVKTAIAEAARPVDRATRLTQEQLVQAEAIFAEFKDLGRPLAEYIRAGVAVIGTGELVAIATAATAWELDMKVEKKLQPGSVNRNMQYLKLYIREQKPTYITDITTKTANGFASLTRIEAEDAKTGPSIYSRLTRLAVLRAFLSFCVGKEWIAKNPLESINTENDLKLAKKRTKDVEVFSTAQCQALLDAALEHDSRFVPFVILATWCFARQAEVLEVTPASVRLDAKVPYVEFGANKLGTPNNRKTTIPANILPLLRECIESGLWAKGTAPFFSVNSFRTVREKAGLIELGKADSRGNRRIISSEWKDNVLRHTGISMLYKKYADLAEGGLFKEAASISAAVTRQAGNSKDVMFAHYLKDVTTEESVAFFAVTGTLKKTIAQSDAQAVA